MGERETRCGESPTPPGSGTEFANCWNTHTVDSHNPRTTTVTDSSTPIHNHVVYFKQHIRKPNRQTGEPHICNSPKPTNSYPHVHCSNRCSSQPSQFVTSPPK